MTATTILDEMIQLSRGDAMILITITQADNGMYEAAVTGFTHRGTTIWVGDCRKRSYPTEAGARDHANKLFCGYRKAGYRVTGGRNLRKAAR